MFSLRDYQREAVDSAFTAWEFYRSLLVVAATGLGKTVLFAEVSRRWPEDAGKILVMAHREELILQARDKIAEHFGEEPEIEMGDFFASRRSTASRVVVTSVQTMSREGRFKRFNPDDFGLLIIDEAHHAAAETYQRVVGYYAQNPSLKVLGVTATPYRKDGRDLGDVFQHVPFDMGIRKGIDSGWLCDVNQKIVEVEGLDLSTVRTTAGDLNERDLARKMGGSSGEELTPEELAEQERMIHSIVSPTIKEAAGRPTLVFCVTKAHAERTAEVFNRHPGVRAACVTDETPKQDRRDIIKRYGRGELQVLVGVGVFTEGFDAPATAVVAMARPTKSLSLYCQMLGRGTRPLPGVVDGPATPEERREAIANSAKPSMTVLDFCGNAGRHKLITAFDVLAGGDDERDVLAALAEAQRNGEAVSVREAVEKARKDRLTAEEEARKREEKRKEEAAARAKLRVDAQYRTYEASPFKFDAAPDVRVGEFRGGASDKQVEYLQKLGVNRATALGYSKQQAGKVIDELSRKSGADYIMRFGKWKGTPLKKIPRDYLRWAKENMADRKDLAAHIDAALYHAVQADYPSGLNGGKA